MDMNQMRRIMSDAHKEHNTDPLDVASDVLEKLGYELCDGYLIKDHLIVGKFEGFNDDGRPLIRLKVPKKEVDDGLPPDKFKKKQKCGGASRMSRLLFFTDEQVLNQVTELRLVYDFGKVIKY